MLRRRLEATTTLLVAALAGACGSSSSGAQHEAQPGAPSIDALRARLTGPVAMSPVILDGGSQSVAVAVMKQRQSPAIPQVLVFRWDGHTWTQEQEVVLDIGGSVADDSGSTTPITTADLTPATVPELLVTVHYNSGPATAVLSRYGGSWHALTFSGGLARAGDERFNVHVDGGALTSQENDCNPNCAQGHLVTTTYRFNPTTGRLEPMRNA